MTETNETSFLLPFTSGSNLDDGLHISAALGGGRPHAFLLDTGSVGIVVPRAVLGPDYQDFDPSQDIEFGYVSSGNTYLGQWVELSVVLGVPPDWDGTGAFPVACVEVFAVDQPAGFNGGVFGVGFGIGGLADGGPARNPLLHLSYQGASLSTGYIVGAAGINVGQTAAGAPGFALITLARDPSGEDWLQPLGSVTLSGGSTNIDFSADLPILIDTGIKSMILWVSADHAPPSISSGTAFPAGISVSITAPPAGSGTVPVLQYSFVTGNTSQPMAPSEVEWRVGKGINTGRNVLAGADYLYDSTGGDIGFRVPPAP